jgi:hypothetical protein
VSFPSRPAVCLPLSFCALTCRVCSIFLYLVLGASFAGISFFVYKTYIEAFFPQAKKAKAPKKVAKVVEEPLSGGEGTATGADKGYDESWIPLDHINRPSAKRVKSGTKKN